MNEATMMEPATNATAAQAVVSAAQGLGALCWWSLTNSRVTPGKMRSILFNEGLDDSIVPDIDQKAAIGRAVREWSQGRGNAPRFKAEIVADDPHEVCVGILTCEKVGAAEVAWKQVDLVAFEIKTSKWSTTGSTPEAVAFMAAADELRFHLDHMWLRPHVLVKGFAKAQAVCLRDRGGVYFVAAEKEPELQQLARIVAQIGSCHLDIVHAQATMESRKAIAEGAQQSLGAELDGLVDRITKWRESSKAVYKNSGLLVLNELTELQQRADLYSSALQVSMADLESAIAEARAAAVGLISGEE